MEKRKQGRFGFESIAFMMQFLKGHRLVFWIGTLMTASFAFLQNIFTGQLYRVVAMIGQGGNAFFGQLLQVFGLLLLIVAVVGIGFWIFTCAAACGDKALWQQLAHKMSHMPMKNWYEKHSGEWLTMLGKDAENAANSYKQLVTRFVSLFIELAGGGLVLSFGSPVLLLYAAISGIVYFGIGVLLRKRNKKYAAGNQQAVGAAASYVADIFNGFIVMRLYHLLRLLMKKQQAAIEEGYDYGKKLARVSVFNGALGQIGYTLAYSGAFVVGLLLVYAGKLELPMMLALWPISMGVSFSIMEFGFFVTDMQPTVVAVERIRTVLELPEETGGEEKRVPESDVVLELRNVTFAYEQGKNVLQDVNLQIRKGEKIAFVGESGSGKSTIVKLLLRFYDVQQGQVLLHGQPVQNYALEPLRSQFAYVPQNACLLSGSIYQNIAMVKPEAAEHQIKTAAENAYADEFIRTLSQGYETQVGERGAQLSGGQRQRVAIARAFLKDAPIMIFDEITAALDGESEAKVQWAVERAPEGKTLLMITHRLSAAAQAERIVVMENGKIAEIGSHNELLAHGTVYKRMWDMQFQK
ncbi:MAG: ABC transporter ATP-binding protein [Clostridia bacterium]|nr:ABC transporter ATP-binding protein [Clostridia bacterium]